MSDISRQALQETTQVLAGLRQFLLEVRRRESHNADPDLVIMANHIGNLVHELNKRGYMELGSGVDRPRLSVIS